jgi:aspartokinase
VIVMKFGGTSVKDPHGAGSVAALSLVDARRLVSQSASESRYASASAQDSNWRLG